MTVNGEFFSLYVLAVYFVSISAVAAIWIKWRKRERRHNDSKQEVLFERRRKLAGNTR